MQGTAASLPSSRRRSPELDADRAHPRFRADKSSWRQVSALLDGNHPLVVPELPGHGQAEPRSARSVEDLAHAVGERLHELGIETAHVVGHSLGGAVAATLVDLGLVSARSLCLIAPAASARINTGSSAPVQRPYRRGATALAGDHGSRAERPSGGYARAVMRQREASGNGQALVDLADALFGEGTQTPSVAARLKRLDLPTKVIWDAAIASYPRRMRTTFPAISASTCCPGVGHVPQLEAPAVVARLVTELARATEGTAR